MNNMFSKMAMLFLAAMLVLTGCTKEESVPESNLTVMEKDVIFEAEGGSSMITVRSNTSWTASCNTPGIDITPSHGTGTKQVRITASKNSTNETRYGYIYFITDDDGADYTVGIEQAGISKGMKDISGTYVGTLKPVGYSDAPARAYVTLTRLSSTSVRVSSLICEEFGLDMNPVNLTVTQESDGSLSLQSETTKSIQGTYYAGKLTLSFSNALATFYFSGTLD